MIDWLIDFLVDFSVVWLRKTYINPAFLVFVGIEGTDDAVADGHEHRQAPSDGVKDFEQNFRLSKGEDEHGVEVEAFVEHPEIVTHQNVADKNVEEPTRPLQNGRNHGKLTPDTTDDKKNWKKNLKKKIKKLKINFKKKFNLI